MNAIDRGLGPDSTTRQDEAEARGQFSEQEILDSLATWRKANPKRRFPPRKVIIVDGPVNVCKVGFVMSYQAGKAQIVTGVEPDGSPDCTWYCKWMYSTLNKGDG